MTSLRADVKVAMALGEDVALEKKRGKFKGVITVAGHDKFRMEILTPLGPPASIVALNGTQFTILMVFTGEFIRGDVTNPRVSAGFARLPVPLEQLPAFLRGAVPLAEGKRVPAKDEQGRDVLIVRDSDKTEIQRITFDKAHGWPVEVKWGGDEPVTVFYEQYSAVDKIAIPHAIRAIDAAGGTAILTLSGVEVNPELPDDLFVLEPPPGAKLHDF